MPCEEEEEEEGIGERKGRTPKNSDGCEREATVFF